MSIIVVEGCDGSGKSTLIEQARQKDRYFLRIQASRYQPTKGHAFKMLNWIRHRPPDIDLVLDRFHYISDRIYGPILRNEDVFADMPLLFGLGEVAAVIYCRPPRQIIIDNVNKSDHLKGVREHIETLIDGYDAAMLTLRTMGKVKVMQYDYTGDDPVAFWRHVFSEVKETKK